MEHMQIQRLAKKCAASFRARIAAYEAENNEYEERRQIVEEQNARFNLWADNNGKKL
jgi:hypothetical protein